MYLFDNPVLHREMLVNLRTKRSFVLLLVYQGLLAAVVMLAWPSDPRLGANAVAARRLVDLFFIGQYLLASLMAPSFAAATMSGEKERKTYEMLLASPMKPGAIVLGKLLASLAHLAVLIFSSLPVVMLCLPLGGVSFSELSAAYLGLMLSVITFGMISVACSSMFNRTSSALVSSYLLILPVTLIAVLSWQALAGNGELRLRLTLTLLPAIFGVIFVTLYLKTCARLLHPPDVGSGGKDVVDLEVEAQQAVGLVIQPDQFPDRLFAPPKREGLLPDGANPVYDKEVRSEIFSQGTRMLRLVIQISMGLAIPIMAFCLFMMPHWAPWFIAYVVVFNMLVGPVFSAGSVTSERERETLDLLLTTTISPGSIIWGKLVAGLRVSSVLTLFLAWPMALACLLVPFYWTSLPSMAAYLCIILLSCLTTSVVALFCSVLFRKTSHSLMTSYLVIIFLFCMPPAIGYFAHTFNPQQAAAIEALSFTSPFSTAFAGVPLGKEISFTDSPWTELREDEMRWDESRADNEFRPGHWSLFFSYVSFTLALNLALLGTIGWLFNSRWRVVY